MSKTRAVLLFVVGIAFGAGITAFTARELHRKQVADEFHLATHSGSTFMFLDKWVGIHENRKARWAWAKREHLEKRLKKEWHEMAYDDGSWAIAFAVLKDKGWQTWKWSEVMDDAEQDDMIRYLCFRIECGSPVVRANALHTEFKALCSYPAEALARHAAKLRRAVKYALRAPDDQVVYAIQRFIVSRIAEPWAQEALRTSFRVFLVEDRTHGAFAGAVRYLLHLLRRSAREGHDDARRLLHDFAAFYREHQHELVGSGDIRQAAETGLKRAEEAGLLSETSQGGAANANPLPSDREPSKKATE